MKNSLPSISHSIKMPAHHFLNFFLTYHHHKCTYSLGSFCSGLIWDYQIAFFTTGDTTNPQILQFPWQHCHITVSLFIHSFCIIPVRFWADLGCFSIDDLNLAYFEGFLLAQGKFSCFTYCSTVLFIILYNSVRFWANLDYVSTDDFILAFCEVIYLAPGMLWCCIVSFYNIKLFCLHL